LGGAAQSGGAQSPAVTLTLRVEPQKDGAAANRAPFFLCRVKHRQNCSLPIADSKPYVQLSTIKNQESAISSAQPASNSNTGKLPVNTTKLAAGEPAATGK
jgi:hypothetical protein